MNKRIIKCMCNPFSVTSHLTELGNISSNTVLLPDSHIIRRDSIDTEMYHDFVKQHLLPVPGPLESLSLWDKMKKKNLTHCFPLYQRQFSVV